MKYCYKCGRKLIKEKGLLFNEKTGEKVIKEVCPLKTCGHAGRPLTHEYHDQGLFEFLFKKNKCEDCEEVM